MEKKDYKNVWEYRIKEAFSNKSKNNQIKNELWEIVNLIIYENSKDRIMVDLFNILSHEDFVKVISVMDGRTFHSPTKKELEETILLALLYYEKEINKKTWSEIQDEFDFELPTIKYGIRIRNLDSWIKQKIQETIRKGDNDEL